MVRIIEYLATCSAIQVFVVGLGGAEWIVERAGCRVKV